MKQLYTKWGRELDSECVLGEYPRPQLMRSDWVCLNGYWDYAITPKGIRPDHWDGRILVPFSPESVLSGVGRQLMPGEVLWYHRTLQHEPDPSNPVTILHFGAVDQTAAVYINGRKAGVHTGGYLPFQIDISSFLRSGRNELAVAVRDVSDTSWHARGKQKLQRGGMYYTAVSGIWQTVWLEQVPESYIRNVDVEWDPDSGKICVTAAADTEEISFRVLRPAIYDAEPYSVRTKPEILVSREIRPEQSSRISLPEIRLWSPETPWLYYYEAKTGRDEVTGYFALRDISIHADRHDVARVFLNGAEYYQRGILDQGYWPDGIYTAPADEALVYDLQEMKRSGFNMVRKHAKIEPERWYYHCDRLGLLVWQDMVNGGTPYKDWLVTYLATFTSWAGWHLKDSHYRLLSRESKKGRIEFEREMEETVRTLKNHPSIVVWVLFNEGWGQFDAVRLTEKLRGLDPSRLIDSTSGWYDQKCGDFVSTHFYFFTYRLKPEKKRAAVLSEVGGYALHIPERSACEDVYGYRQDESRDALMERYRKLIRYMDSLRAKGLCGYVYTQWSDIEEEVNGIVTYDREERKISPMTAGS